MTFWENDVAPKKLLDRGKSAALGYFSVSIFFVQVANKELKHKYSCIAV